jgi:hypothetical protein
LSLAIEQLLCEVTKSSLDRAVLQHGKSWSWT